jgi:Cysteine rich repeat
MQPAACKTASHVISAKLHAYRLNFRLRDSCKDDLATLCPDVCKDATKHACGGRALRCLTDNSEQIRSKACRNEVFYFEKMEVRPQGYEIVRRLPCVRPSIHDASRQQHQGFLA